MCSSGLFVPFIQRPLHFFNKSCPSYSYLFGTFPFHIVSYIGYISTYHWLIKSSNSDENWLGGNLGGSSLTTCFNCSKGVPQVLYGNFSVANSSNEIPKLHTSDLMSYWDGLPDGSIRSGCKKIKIYKSLIKFQLHALIITNNVA